tara:strand:+ start:2791 stop:3318 length:528 start_codon:yes stop_codon:yes gene_type:complete
MARIDASGIDFSDGTELNSKYDIIPQNSVMIFYETSAPGGWTKVTSHDNKALRVVSGTGGGFGSGGTAGPGGSPFTNVMTTRPFSGTFTATGTIGATTLTTQQIPSHSHNAGSSVTVSPGSPGVQGRRVNGQAPATSPTGGGQSHTHPFAGNPAPYSGSLDLRVQYIDVILCQFN